MYFWFSQITFISLCYLKPVLLLEVFFFFLADIDLYLYMIYIYMLRANKRNWVLVQN